MSCNSTVCIHDPEFKNLITVPRSAIHHMPPAHLEISRLVMCRKYNPANPRSCAMGNSCKFVHIDTRSPQMTVQSIHVNYAWRSEEEVTHERLQAGEMLTVMAPNNRAPSQLVPSELILVTRGSMNRHESKGPLSHCAHYYFNRMCSRGERCGFIHALYIDPTATEFQRAPTRAGAGYAEGHSKQTVAAQPRSATPETEPCTVLSASHSSCDIALSDDRNSSMDGSETHSVAATPSKPKTPRVLYRHNPYSVVDVQVPVVLA